MLEGLDGFGPAWQRFAFKDSNILRSTKPNHTFNAEQFVTRTYPTAQNNMHRKSSSHWIKLN